MTIYDKILNKRNLCFIKHEDGFVICRDAEGYIYKTKYDSLLYNKKIYKYHVSNPYTLYNLQLFFSLNNLNIVVANQRYQGSKHPILISCIKCGGTHLRSLDDILHRKTYMCRDCVSKMGSLNGLKHNASDVESMAKKMGYKILSPYINNETKMLCINPDGYFVYAKSTFFTTQNKSSPIVFSTVHNESNYIKNINHWFSLHNISCEALYYTKEKDVYGGRPKIYCKCKCGNIFYNNINALMDGSHVCGECGGKMSKISRMVALWLSQHDIKYELEKSFNDLYGDKYLLKFDFYLPQYNICIEVDGKQHDEIVNFGNDTYNIALLKFQKGQKYDKLKNQYCKDNNIKLLRIKEDDIRKSNNYKIMLYNTLIKK